MTAYTFDLPPYDPFYDQPSPAPELSPANFDLPQPASCADTATTQTITLRMPKDLLNRVDNLARQEDISRSQCMRRITSFVVDAIRSDPETIAEYGAVAEHLYEHAKQLINQEQHVSVSLLQRHLKLDYHMALLLMDELERTGFVTPPDHEGRRTTMLQHLIKLAAADRAAPAGPNQSWLDRKP
ncbi:ribbon-helix-helix protein, CopG family [Pseudoduganella sp. FT26W]|uniref:Ribbon-helix-helix protein, CopG family n=1 Tax=Duganella aquatilis TaxID=2666082 RepID=A0A844D6H9_9BURK|nr:DNA translocase FtsK [Duganella aquatilis]MRW83726.1 ribbon-helix-helix protein, CopG family [Duganella aquatilis]